MPAPQRLTVGHSTEDLCIDSISVEPSMTIVVEGWTRDPAREISDIVDARLDGQALPLLNEFRVARSDVAAVTGSGGLFHGVVWQFRRPTVAAPTALLELVVEGVPAGSFTVAGGGAPIAYDALVDSPVPHRREHIYNTGQPDPTINTEALTLALDLPEPVLDFGCGSGALVAALRDVGRAAEGIEVDRAEIRSALHARVRDHVVLTDGTFPVPLADRSYASVVATEVLEHIDDVATAAAELARIADREILVTVPDASAIPALYPHAVVPWHLLEGSHLQFFSPPALEALFAPDFVVSERFRIGRVEVNGTVTFTSLAVRLHRQRG